MVIFIFFGTFSVAIISHLFCIPAIKPYIHTATINLVLCLVTLKLFASVTMFNVCVLFIIERFRCINLILKQLLLEETVENNFVILNLKSGFCSEEIDGRWKQMAKKSAWTIDDGRKNKNSRNSTKPIYTQNFRKTIKSLYTVESVVQSLTLDDIYRKM